MKLFLWVALLCAGCVTKERVVYKTLPPQIIERHYLVPVMPIQMEKQEAAPEKKPDMSA